MYTLKSTLKRGMTLSAGLGLVVASFASMATPVFADALNPLTERSLTLSSSSPGWANTDGSGNSTYAPPNSGANGYKSGNYFDFKVSSAGTVKTMSFQYCTTSAGACFIPGDLAAPSATPDFVGQKADLNVNYPTANGEVASGDFNTVVNATGANKGLVKAVPGYTNNNPKYSGTGDPAEAAKNVNGHFIVMYYDAAGDGGNGEWVQSTGWTVSAANVNDPSDTRTTNNYITLTKNAGVALTAGQQVKVLFFANDTDYITNPGSGAFFVKINTYDVEYNASPTLPQVDLTGLMPSTDTNVIDGGVTVANVMNQSIQITTKVLETMEFSVGTVDPSTLDSTDGTTGSAAGGITAADASTYETALGVLPTADGSNDFAHKKHGPCDLIAKGMSPTDPQNVLQLGNQNAESSLETANTYATHSYWRLSSNSSAGATVYYSGHTLSNTVGDEITPIGPSAAQSAPGSEQFGLAISTVALGGGQTYDTGSYGVNYATAGSQYENAADNGITGVHSSTLTDLGADIITPDYTGLNKSYHTPRLNPLVL